MPLRLRPTLGQVLAQASEPIAGIWVCSGSPLVAEIVAGSGTDWVLIDMEHAPNDLGTTLHQLQAVSAYPATPVVRVPSQDAVIIKQVLDLGAQNLLVPMVSSAAEAHQVVRAAHYPPRGVRGVGSALARSGRWNRVDDYLTDAERHVSVVVQIETTAGVEAAAQIAAIAGVDGVFVGPSDLAASMGHLGHQDHPEVKEAVLHTFQQVRSAGKPVGVNAFDPSLAQSYFDAGASFALVGADVAILARGTEALSSRFSTSGERTGRPERTSY